MLRIGKILNIWELLKTPNSALRSFAKMLICRKQTPLLSRSQALILAFLGVPIILFSILFFYSSCDNKPYSPAVDDKDLSEILLDANKLQIAYDTLRAISFIRLNNWNMQQTKTGIWYEIIDSAQGPPIQEGNIVAIEYTVKLMDGTLCYSSEQTGPKVFRVNLGGVENGLEDGIVLLRGGDSARFVMPQYRAHHLLGDGVKIPPLTTIIYNLRVIEVAFR